MPHAGHLENAARAKLGAPEGWRAWRFEAAAGGYVVSGAVPAGWKRTEKGPKRPVWKGDGQTVVLTEAEVSDEIVRYIRATGNCPGCMGTREELERWSRQDGAKMRPCRDCGGTGKAWNVSPGKTGKPMDRSKAEVEDGEGDPARP